MRPVTTRQAAELTADLLSIASQHDHQQLLQPQGIGPTPRIEDQVPVPVVGALMARVEGFDPLRFGTTVVTANSIRVEPGFWTPKIGEPSVWNPRIETVLREGAAAMAGLRDDPLLCRLGQGSAIASAVAHSYTGAGFGCQRGRRFVGPCQHDLAVHA